MPTADKQDRQVELIEQFARMEEQNKALTREMKESLALLTSGISERYGHIGRKLEKLQHLLVGNGTDGLIVESTASNKPIFGVAASSGPP